MVYESFIRIIYKKAHPFMIKIYCIERQTDNETQLFRFARGYGMQINNFTHQKMNFERLNNFHG